MRQGFKKLYKKIVKRPRLKWTLIALGVVTVLMIAVVAAYHLAFTQRVFPRVSVGAIELSNLTIPEAESLLVKSLPREIPTVNLVLGGNEWPLELNKLRLKYEPKTTAQKAYLLGRGGRLLPDIAAKWRLWWRGEAMDYSYTVDESGLAEKLNMVADQLDEPAIEPNLTLSQDGRVELTPGRNGRLVDRSELMELVRARIGRLDFDQIGIPIELVTVAVDGGKLSAAQERAERLKEKTIELDYDDNTRQVSGQELLDLIDFNGGFSEVKVASLSSFLAAEIDRPAQNALFNFDGTRVVEFKPALPGLKLNEAEARAMIADSLAKLEGQEEARLAVRLPLTKTEAAVKTEDVNDLGIKELLGVGESTFHGSIATREHNIALTAARLNGVLVPPGEVFSFNQMVGDVSAATGYQSAYIIKDGRTILGDGGGGCQDSTTVFRAALDAGLPIVERHAHSYRVKYYEQNAPPGIDATVYAPSVDLKFKNDTPAHILVQALADTGSNYLRVEIYGTSDGREATVENAKIWGQAPPPAPLYQDDPTLPLGTVNQVDWAAWGAKTSFDWRVTRNGEVINEKTFYSNFRPWQAVYLRGTGGI